MIIKLYNYLKKRNEDLALGLVFGLALGLASGLVSGLAFSLVSGLVSGLVFGLAFSLALGLAFGLVFGLAFSLALGLAFGLVNYPQLAFPFWLLLVCVLILSEILFLFHDKVKKPSLGLTTKRKAESLFESFLILINILNVRYILKNIDFSKYLPLIIKWIEYMGIGLIYLIVILGILYLWVKLNQRILRK